jgi:hypothetical protein
MKIHIQEIDSQLGMLVTCAVVIVHIVHSRRYVDSVAYTPVPVYNPNTNATKVPSLPINQF